MLALFAATVPPARYASAACDALSIVQVTTAVIGGVGLAALTFMRGLSLSVHRLAGVTVLGLVLGAMMVFALPACLGDPLGPLGPRLSELWIAHNSEARSVISMLRDLPQDVLPTYGLPAVGLVIGVLQCLRERNGQRRMAGARRRLAPMQSRWRSYPRLWCALCKLRMIAEYFLDSGARS
jgi:hypothetical protein